MITFNGKITRAQYWLENLLWIPCRLFVAIVAGCVAYHYAMEGGDFFALEVVIPALICVVTALLTYIISFAVTVKRLRDAGQSPLLVLLSFVPFIQFPFFIVVGCLSSK